MAHEIGGAGKRAAQEQYVAYVGTYTHGSSIGIHIYDLDVEAGYMTEREVIPVNNASHMTKSYNGKYLYSIADEGVEVLKILPDGGLSTINQVGIDGMRGCYLSTDQSGKFLFVGGYHDAKVTVVHTHKTGRLGSVMDGVFHKGLGLGSVGSRNFLPHVSCVIPTPDNKYLCAVDNGIDQVKIYKVNEKSGKLQLFDILRCKLDSGPRLMTFDPSGRFAYINCDMTNEINVYRYDGTGKSPDFELIQTVPTLRDPSTMGSACCGMKMAPSGKYLYASNAGENTAAVFAVAQESAALTKLCSLPISGEYPKDIDVFPGERTLVVLNHETNEIRFFTIDYEKKLLVMKGRPIQIDTPNCILISKVE
ncbi:MAG: lactonase family protein [Lachnospiraceae bacterium]|nr:lactonase family protein [Lachnospiraceae bacterium]